MKIPFIKYSNVWFVLSGAIVVAAVIALAVWGLKFGIDFTGGSLLEVSFNQNRPTAPQVVSALDEMGLKGSVVQTSGDKKLFIRTTFLNEEQHQTTLATLRSQFATGTTTMEENQFQTVGGLVSATLRQRAIWAVILVNVAIIVYVAYAFRKVSRPIASWKYGTLAIVALLHDILVVLGAFAVLGHFLGIEVGIDFVVALLTVLGFSVTDTIVVYDRIRENLLHHRVDNFAEVVNTGLNDTLMRSINTTLTVLLPLFALLYFGGASIHSFALALFIGMASGAYSSIFIASPLLVTVEQWQRKA